MTPDQPPPLDEVPELTSFERKLLGSVIIGALGVGSLGLYSSYDSVSDAAKNWGFDPEWVLPVALDVSIPVFSLGHLLLVRMQMELAWVRFLPWALTLATVYLNVQAAGDDPAAQLGHGALPMLWVACSEIAAHVYRVLIGARTGRRMERVRRSRWLLAPVTTARLWRRMILWEIRSYRIGLALERDRQLARADLRDKYGRLWRRKVTRRELAELRFGELAPVMIPEPAPVPVIVPPQGGPVGELERNTDPAIDLEPDWNGVPDPGALEPVDWNDVVEPEPEPVRVEPGVEPAVVLERNEPQPVERSGTGPVEPVEPVERNEPDPVERGGMRQVEPVAPVPVPELSGTERVERSTGTEDLPGRASKKEQQVRAVVELVERYGMEQVTPKFVKEQTGIPPTTAFRRIKEARERLERGESTGTGGTERSPAGGTMIGTERTGT